MKEHRLIRVLSDLFFYLLYSVYFQWYKNHISTGLVTSRYSFNMSSENCYSAVVRVLMLNRKAVMKIYYDIKKNAILTKKYAKNTTISA